MEEGNRKAKTVQINHDGIINAVEFCPHSKAVDLLAYTIGPRLTLAKLEGSKKLQVGFVSSKVFCLVLC
eukprot:m.37071 g.37071  ORF g.37071 m.37071 type:complete len:69 (-) comp9239_c0_seq2:1124-1330(-)